MPRWALPNESVPMSICWPKHVEWDELRINLPEKIIVTELSNIEEVEFEEESRTLIVKKIFQTVEIVPEDYIVISMSYPISDKIPLQEKIQIQLLKQGSPQYSAIGYLRIFRPHIEVRVLPGARIILSEVYNKGKLPILMKIFGFGDIKIYIRATTRCELSTNTGDLRGSILKEFFRFMLNLEDHSEISKPEKEASIDFQVNPELIKDVLSEIKSILDGTLSAEIINLKEIDEEELHETIHLLKSMESHLEELLNTFLYKLLIDTGKKFPKETIEFENISALFDSNILAEAKILSLIIDYQDKLGNTYESNTVQIPVIDERKSKQKHPVIRVDFQPSQWEVNQLQNVEEFNFG